LIVAPIALPSSFKRNDATMPRSADFSVKWAGAEQSIMYGLRPILGIVAPLR
jgi:hypothetical protein